MKAVLAILVSLLALGTGMGGCVAPSAVAAGAGITALEYGVTAWRKGLLSTAELASLDDAHAAVLQTLSELEFANIKGRRAENGRWTEWIAIDGQDRKVKVRCTRISPVMTKLKIRIGILGDEAVSLALHQQINERLRAERARRADAPPLDPPTPASAEPAP